MRVITLNEKKEIIGVKFLRDDYILQENEIETDLGELGQVQQLDGTFADVAIEETIQEPVPTLEDKINYLYYKGLGVI